MSPLALIAVAVVVAGGARASGVEIVVELTAEVARSAVVLFLLLLNGTGSEVLDAVYFSTCGSSQMARAQPPSVHCTCNSSTLTPSTLMRTSFLMRGIATAGSDTHSN